MFGEMGRFGDFGEIVNFFDKFKGNLASTSRLDKQLHFVEIIDEALFAVNIH